MKEKAIAEEVKVQFGTDRGSRGMIIKNINEPSTRFVTKLMVCKLLKKNRKEEASIGLIETVVQCVKGIVLIWESCFLNLFLEYCRDA